jgi:hypothetical protein
MRTAHAPESNPTLVNGQPPHRRWFLLLGVVAVVMVVGAIYVIPHLAPSNAPESGLIYVIPEGAADQLDLPTIDSAITIPTSITFATGEDAMLSIVNNDRVANRAGPWVVGAGQTYSIRFDKPGVYEYVCSVDAAESVTITVE